MAKTQPKSAISRLPGKRFPPAPGMRRTGGFTSAPFSMPLTERLLAGVVFSDNLINVCFQHACCCRRPEGDVPKGTAVLAEFQQFLNQSARRTGCARH